MAKSQVLRYWIHLPDKALVDTLNDELDAGGGPTVNAHGSILVAGNGQANGLYTAPYDPGPPVAGAAVTANLLSGLNGAAPVKEQGQAMASPALTSEWFVTSNNFPRNVATFTRKSGGWFGIPLLFGNLTTFYWSGRFVFTPLGTAVTDPSGTVVVSPAPIPTRYFLETFELPTFGNGGASSGGKRTRDASGFTEGYGAGFRKATGSILQHTLYEYLVGGVTTSPQKVWERMYYTLRTLPATPQLIHYTEGYPTASNGTALVILPTGQLAAYILSGASAILLGTMATALTVGRRYKLDHLINWRTDNSATSEGFGRYRLYVGGVRVFDSGNVSTGPGAAISRQQISNLAQTYAVIVTTADVPYEADIDYWHCAAIPNLAGVESLTSIDWLNGSRGIIVEPSAEASDFASWTSGMFRAAGNRPANRTDVLITSTTSGAIASYVTNAPTRIRNIRPSLGVASFVVGLNGYRGTNSGDLGYKLNGGADVYAAVAQSAGPNPLWNTALYTGPASNLPLTLTALEVKYRKGADVVAGGIQILMACVELVGVFGIEDVTEGDDGPGVSSKAGVHNSAYPETPWANIALPVFAPYQVTSGTYTGNGTTQDITLKSPPVFVAVRRVTGAGDTGGWWTTALLGAHINLDRGVKPAIRCLVDPSYAGATAVDEAELRYLLRIASTDAQVNTNTQTYHYFIVSDPAARFHLAGAVAHSDSGTLPKADALADPDFLPEYVEAWNETLDSSGTASLVAKDDSVITVNADLAMASATETANALTMALALLTLRAGLVAGAYDQIAYLAIRSDDGNGPFDIPPVITVGWTGDGTASRTISVDMGGRRPLWAISAGTGHVRDASHTSTSSTRLSDGVEDASGFTAGGIDSISIGANMNSNGKPYVIRVYPGSATAGNNGWSIDGEFWLVEPDSAMPDDWEAPSIVAPVVAPDAETPDNGTDFAVGCVAFSQAICNRALAHLGISRQIADLAAETGLAATQCRLHFSPAVEATLRDFPWAFATRYATLVLVDGTDEAPVNNDWTFSYREPDDNMMARRLTSQLGLKRLPDVDPPKFRMGTDDDGGLVYADLSSDDADVVLEYTARLDCPAKFGDALFREAMSWYLAFLLAPVLAKDSQKAQECLRFYAIALADAQGRNAGEQQQDLPAQASWIDGR